MALLPSQCRYSGDIKCIRNRYNLRSLGYWKIVGRLCNAPTLELKFCIEPKPEVLGT